ncbi:MAG: glycosyltransferase [Clostridia bacterium]|nr:glycosyltransferase [Clostridia bacterium]
MKKIAFVIPWFAADIPGGAEMLCRETTRDLKMSGVDVEILTTCIQMFGGDWTKNYYKEGIEIINDVPVRRFKITGKRNKTAFDEVNIKLMSGQKISRKEEMIFIDNQFDCPELYEYIKENQDDYTAFVYIPYMFATTYYGIKACPEKAVMIPCFHEEAYIYLKIFYDTFSSVAGMLFNAEPEAVLADRVYDTSHIEKVVPGCVMDIDITSNAQAFRDKYKINDPFILYAGRKDAGKNISFLLRCFEVYKRCNRNNLKLVFIGGGDLLVPKDIEKDVYDLGFVSKEDKYNAHAAALLLCQPSTHESFSIVIMDSWLCGRPVLVPEACDVTTNFVKKSNGGYYFRDYREFEACVNYTMEHPDIAAKMGEQGGKFVRENFNRETVCNKYIELFEKLEARNSQK